MLIITWKYEISHFIISRIILASIFIFVVYIIIFQPMCFSIFSIVWNSEISDCYCHNKFDTRLQSDVSSLERLLPLFYWQITTVKLVLPVSLQNVETNTPAFLNLKNQIIAFIIPFIGYDTKLHLMMRLHFWSSG